MIRVNSADLTKLILTCFDLASDDSITAAQQSAWMTVGKRLRGSLVNVLTAQFDDSTRKVKDANAELKRINESLKTAVQDMERLRDELVAAKALVSAFDSVLKLATFT